MLRLHRRWATGPDQGRIGCREPVEPVEPVDRAAKGTMALCNLVCPSFLATTTFSLASLQQSTHALTLAVQVECNPKAPMPAPARPRRNHRILAAYLTREHPLYHSIVPDSLGRCRSEILLPCLYYLARDDQSCLTPSGAARVAIVGDPMTSQERNRS